MTPTTWDWRAEHAANVRARLRPRIRGGRKPSRIPLGLTKKACRKLVRAELKALPGWARDAEPGVALLKPAEITVAAIKAVCRACGKCPGMGG
jgi:hypothetical protein